MKNNEVNYNNNLEKSSEIVDNLILYKSFKIKDIDRNNNEEVYISLKVKESKYSMTKFEIQII